MRPVPRGSAPIWAVLSEAEKRLLRDAPPPLVDSMTILVKIMPKLTDSKFGRVYETVWPKEGPNWPMATQLVPKIPPMLVESRLTVAMYEAPTLWMTRGSEACDRSWKEEGEPGMMIMMMMMMLMMFLDRCGSACLGHRNEPRTISQQPLEMHGVPWRCGGAYPNAIRPGVEVQSLRRVGKPGGVVGEA